MKKIISILLALVMALSLLPTAVFAIDTDDMPVDTTVVANKGEVAPDGENDAQPATKVETVNTGEEISVYTNPDEANGIAPLTNEGSTVNVAKVNGTEYATLAEAIEAAKSGDTVTLLTNIRLTETLTITKDIILDISGRTLTVAASGDGIVVSNAELTLANNGDAGKYIFECSAGNSDGIYLYNTEDGKTSVLNLNSNIEILVTSTVNSAIHAFCEKGNAIVNINAGKITASGSGKQFKAIHIDQNATLNMNGGELDLNIDFDSYSDNNDVVGVLIWGSNGKQENCSVNIKNGTFKVGGRNAFAQVVQVGMSNGYSKNCNVNISGGNVVLNPTENGTGYIYATYKTSYATATISGGNVSGNVTALVIPYITVSEITNDGLTVSGGTFSTAVDEKYLAEDAAVKVNTDGTHTIMTKPVEVWTGYTGTKVASYATIAEAANNLGKNKWIVVAKDYTLTENFTIPEGVFLDIAGGATLTVAEGVTLTVAANAKRLGIRTGAALINHGTILICGTSNANGYVMVQSGSTFDINTLSVPEGYFLSSNGSNYYVTENSKAFFEITYSDGKTKKIGRDDSWDGAAKVTLLQNITDFAKSFVSIDNLAKIFVLDLGGYTMSGKADASTQVLSISVPMTIQNGTIKYLSSNKGYGALTTSANVTIASNATIDGGVGYAIYTDGYGHTLTVNGTVQCNGSYAITGNGSDELKGNKIDVSICSITVNRGAKISAPNGIAIYHPELGTVTVNGGSISGHTGIEMCAGKLIVNGGTITSTGDNYDATGSQNAILDGAAISLINRNYPGGIPSAELKGGTIKATGKNALAVKAYDYSNDTVAKWTDVRKYVEITGGTYSNDVTEYADSGYIVRVDGTAAYTVVRDSRLTEGTYTAEPKSVANGYLVIDNEDGTWTVQRAPEKHPVRRYPANNSGTGTGAATDTDKTVKSSDTGDMGVALYAVTALLSVTGMAWVGRKRGN